MRVAVVEAPHIPGLGLDPLHTLRPFRVKPTARVVLQLKVKLLIEVPDMPRIVRVALDTAAGWNVRNQDAAKHLAIHGIHDGMNERLQGRQAVPCGIPDGNMRVVDAAEVACEGIGADVIVPDPDVGHGRVRACRGILAQPDLVPQVGSGFEVTQYPVNVQVGREFVEKP